MYTNQEEGLVFIRACHVVAMPRQGKDGCIRGFFLSAVRPAAAGQSAIDFMHLLLGRFLVLRKLQLLALLCAALTSAHTATIVPNTNGRSDVGSVEAQLAPTPTPPSTTQLLNISTRLRVETGDSVAISGFIIDGAGFLQVAIRGMGPSLGPLGLPDFLADPILEVRDSTGALLVQNDNWRDDSTQAAELTKLELAPGHAEESALVVSLQPGAYTAIVAGKNNGTGIGLVEVYNVDHTVPVANVELVNISTRGFVQTGDNVMIGGFILHGPDEATTAIRGIGPSLSQFGIPNPLPDPTLELRDINGTLLVANDNWQDDPVSAAQLTAHGLAPQNPLESAIYLSLQPNPYTAILAGKNGGTGVGLVEIYNLN